MVLIESLEIKRKYQYVWLKYVNGFNLSMHCARCLKGTYDKRINRGMLTYGNLELPPSPYYYFCTVWQYEMNIHLAFAEAEGESIFIDDDRYSVAIKNARQIKFDNSRIDPNHPCAKITAYNTCRNWWFAHWIVNSENDMKPPAVPPPVAGII